MSRIVLPIVVLVVIVGLGAGWQMLTPTAASRNEAPPFTVRTLDGKTQRLSDLRGRPVLLDFWATWCAPCRASLPNLDAMQRRYGARGLVVLGLSVDDDGPVAVRRFADRLGVRFPIAMAEEKVLADYGPIRTIPTTILINRRGQVVRRVVGYLDEETLDGYVREIL